MKDISKLVAVKIVDKNGNIKTVYKKLDKLERGFKLFKKEVSFNLINLPMIKVNYKVNDNLRGYFEVLKATKKPIIIEDKQFKDKNKLVDYIIKLKNDKKFLTDNMFEAVQ